jgi:hypothetical protein
MLDYSVDSPQEAGEGRTAHNNGWNGVNGMVLLAKLEIIIMCEQL